MDPRDATVIAEAQIEHMCAEIEADPRNAPYIELLRRLYTPLMVSRLLDDSSPLMEFL